MMLPIDWPSLYEYQKIIFYYITAWHLEDSRQFIGVFDTGRLLNGYAPEQDTIDDFCGCSGAQDF
jgi:hypothetical protein